MCEWNGNEVRETRFGESLSLIEYHIYFFKLGLD